MTGSRLAVRRFERADVPAAAALIAARQRRMRERLPALPGEFEDPAACPEHFEFILDMQDHAGVVAERDGRIAGFLLGFTSNQDYGGIPIRQTMTLAPAHAVQADEDATAVYNALYGAVARRWVDRGRYHHLVHVPAGAPAVDEAWTNLGFGRRSAFAARDLRPLDGAVRRDVRLRESGEGDLDAVVRIGEVERAFGSRSPMFGLYFSDDDVRRARENHQRIIEDDAATHFLASVDGEDCGLITLTAPRGSPIVTPARSVYIGETSVLGSARGAGVGTALVDAALAWARERGFEHAVLHFSPLNPISPGFWTGHGWIPVLYHLERRIDPRATWAHAEE